MEEMFQNYREENVYIEKRDNEVERKGDKRDREVERRREVERGEVVRE